MTISKTVAALSSSEIVLELKVLKAIVEPPVQALQARATLKDGYILQINESAGPNFRRYFYHLQKGDAMIKRWDNSPHWKDLKHSHIMSITEMKQNPKNLPKYL